MQTEYIADSTGVCFGSTVIHNACSLTHWTHHIILNYNDTNSIINGVACPMQGSIAIIIVQQILPRSGYTLGLFPAGFPPVWGQKLHREMRLGVPLAIAVHNLN